jgi:hypothetical protein
LHALLLIVELFICCLPLAFWQSTSF